MNLTIRKVYVFLSALLGLTGSVMGQEADILEMSLEDLMNMEITSVSKKAERLQDVMSSIYVVSSSDIANSGATTLHEALRLVPGYWGVQNEYSKPTSNIRYSGPAEGRTGTILYLLDGTPIQNLMGSDFSFRNFDIPLDEIDRIEVIRGSGGTIYGANSATGVVNIFTKSPDKYDGINARGEVANGGYINTTLRAGGKISDKVAISGYAKMRMFDGFGSIAGTDSKLNNVVEESRYTEDYESLDMYSMGAKMTFAASESTKISVNTHYNALNTLDYSGYFAPDYFVTGNNTIVSNEVNSNRMVASAQLDQQFSENNNLFIRVSSQSENDYSTIAGGYDFKNSILDFEVQDNLSIGSFNDLSLGGNFRFVNIDVTNINQPDAINYTNPKTSETLKGIFLQDKIKLANGKFNVLVGIKAENYSLVNNEFYFSPMAKFNFIPTTNITFWGGYTQSYSTPGFNNTNVDLVLVPTDPIIGVQNGSNTVPSRFRTWEIGFRANATKTLSVESNFYYTNISDGIGVNPGDAILQDVPSPTQPSRTGDYYLYGNYVEGTTKGTESTIKFMPTKGIKLEFSHAYLTSEWTTQKNPDFDVDALTKDQRDQTPDIAYMPTHVFNIKGSFTLPAGFQFDMSLIHGTKFRTQSRYQIQGERYRNIAFELNDADSENVSPNNERTIVNLRVEKKLFDNQLSVYGFGQDIFNKGIQANADNIFYATRHQIKGMFGLGLNYKFN